MTTSPNKAKFYRGVHPHVRDEVKKVARSLCVPADDVASVLIEAGIQGVETETLRLEPRPSARRMTLFPENGEPTWSYSQMPLLPSDVSPVINPVLVEKKLWQFVVSYRIPDEIHEKLKKIANEYSVGVGAVASYFLQWGLQAYYEKRLNLVPRTVAIKQTLLFGGTSP